MDPLLQALRVVRRRLLIVQWVRFTMVGLLGASCAACAWLLTTKAFPLLGDATQGTLGFLAIGLLAAAAWTIRKRPTIHDAALEADRRLGLHERLTSSLELAGNDAPMVEALHQDARDRLAQLDYRRVFPFGAPRLTRWVAVPLALYLAGYLLLPEFDLFGQREREALAKERETAIRIEADRILEAAKPLREAIEEGRTDLEGDALAIERIAADLKSGEITEKQAVARLANLNKTIADHQEKLGAKMPTLNAEANAEKFGMAKDLANNLQKGDFGKAADAAKELMEKAASGELSQDDQKKLAEDLSKLSEELGGQNSELGKALAQVASGMTMNDLANLQASMEALKLSLEDIKSIAEQLAKLEQCQNSFAQCQNKLACSKCNGICKGNCLGDQFAEGRGGLGGPGRGRGNQIGELPDVQVNMDPSMLPGEMTKGNILASIMQRAAPSEDATSEVEYSAESFTAVKQQAEEALTREEIPPGAQEFVRQYFGSLEPQTAASGSSADSAPPAP